MVASFIINAQQTSATEGTNLFASSHLGPTKLSDIVIQWRLVQKILALIRLTGRLLKKQWTSMDYVLHWEAFKMQTTKSPSVDTGQSSLAGSTNYFQSQRLVKVCSSNIDSMCCLKDLDQSAVSAKLSTLFSKNIQRPTCAMLGLRNLLQLCFEAFILGLFPQTKLIMNKPTSLRCPAPLIFPDMNCQVCRNTKRAELYVGLQILLSFVGLHWQRQNQIWQPNYQIDI